MRRLCSTQELQELSCILVSSRIQWDWGVAQEFPIIHQIVLGRIERLNIPGRSEELLTREIDRSPGAVHATDASMRTALDWATAMAKLAHMRLLLDRGSTANSMDRSGRTTVLHAVDSHNLEALRMILEAGGNPNPRLPPHIHRSSPLIAASFGGLTEMVKLLAKFGAELDACDPEGWTALQKAVISHNTDCVKTLLNLGADLSHLSDNGQSALTTAIIHNSHDVLQLFIDECRTRHRLDGPQLLPVVAEHADTKTMSMLASSGLLSKQTLWDTDGVAAGRVTICARMDPEERLHKAFEELILSLDLIEVPPADGG